MDWLFGWFDKIVQSMVWKSFFGNFHWCDWALILFVLIGLVYGIKAGLFRVFFDILEAILVSWICINLYPVITKLVLHGFPKWPRNKVSVAAFVFIMIASFFAVKGVDAYVSKVFQTKLANPWRALGGAVTGIIYGIFMWSLISQPVVLSTWPLLTHAYEKDGSLTGYKIKMIVPKVCRILLPEPSR